MPGREAHQVAVIGLGGGGSTVVQELKERLPQAADYLSLDVDSDIFGDFYYGYQCDVIPPIQTWVQLDGGTVRHWFDVRTFVSPLRDIPDIFLRSTTRPVMKASLLMWRTRVKSYLEEKLQDPDEVILTTQLTGSTGSAWILEVAMMLKELFPSANFRLIFSEGTQEGYSDSVPTNRALANSYWTLKEIDSGIFHTPEPEVAPSVAIATSRIENLLSGSSDGRDVSGYPKVPDALFNISQKIKSSFVDQFACATLLNCRADSFSKILGPEEWSALIGLLLAFAEDRVERESIRNEKCWNSVTFHSRSSGGREVIVIPNVPSVAKEVLGLAHSCGGFGPEEHQRAYETLSQEGSAALAGHYAPVAPDTITRLVEIRNSIMQRLDQVSDLGIRETSHRYFVDLYPELLTLMNQLLINNGIEDE